MNTNNKAVHSAEVEAAGIDERTTHVHCLLYWAKQQPHSVYLTQPLPDGQVVTTTWAEAADQVCRMAAYLHTLELPPASHIALFGKNSDEWILADMAIMLAGHVSVPMYPTLNAKSAQHVFSHGDVAALFIGKLDGISDSWNEVKEVIPGSLRCVRLAQAPEWLAPSWRDIVTATEPLTDVTLPDVDQLATIMYTSGSTGLPKGVMHSFRTMMQVARLAESQFGIVSSDRFLSYLPLAHTAERALVEALSLYCGTSVFFSTGLETFVQDLRRASPTLFFSVPRLWTKFYQGINEKLSPAKQKLLFALPVVGKRIKKKIVGELGLQDVRFAITGSAPLPSRIMAWYRNLGLELLEGYAMTENFCYSHVNRPGDNLPGYVGYAQEGVDCRIDDAGELLIKSPGNMLGYYKAPEKTAQALSADGYLHTGDMGEIDACGRLKITGRVKDLFKTAKGKYVAPVPIEQQLASHPAVEAVCVGGGSLPNPVAFVMLAEAAGNFADKTAAKRLEEELGALLETTNAGLEHHEQMLFLLVADDAWTIEGGLLTPTLKIKRSAIEQRYESRLENWKALKRSVVWEAAG